MLCLFAVLLGAAVASAHPPPLGIALALHPSGDPQQAVLMAQSRGFIAPGEGNQRVYGCLEGLQLALTERPGLTFTSDGQLVVGSTRGLLKGPDLCRLETNADIGTLLVQDLHPDPSTNTRLWAVTNQGSADNGLFASQDEGDSWSLVYPAATDTLLNRVRVSPADPQRVYLGGSQILLDPPREAPFLRVSEDGGQTFERELSLPLGELERSRRLVAAHPTQADTVFVMASRGESSTTPDVLLRSDNGGFDFEPIEVGATGAVGPVFDETGRRAWIAGLNGVFASDDGARSFVQVRDDLVSGCIAYAQGRLYLCSWHAAGSFALGVSDDAGQTFEALVQFNDATEPLRCEQDPSVLDVCQRDWEDWQFEVLRMPFNEPSEDSGCHASPGHGGPGAPLYGLAALALLLGRRRRLQLLGRRHHGQKHQ